MIDEEFLMARSRGSNAQIMTPAESSVPIAASAGNMVPVALVLLMKNTR